MTAARPPRCERMTGPDAQQLADLLAQVREVVGDWEHPPGRPPDLPLFDALVAELFGCSQATITCYHQHFGPTLRWVLALEVEQRLARMRRLQMSATRYPGARHDSMAFHLSGIAHRWADHRAPGGPGVTGGKANQGTGRSHAGDLQGPQHEL